MLVKKEDKSNDADEEVEPYIVESFPKSFQAGWGVAEGLIRRGVLNKWMMWLLILVFALHALPNNSPVSFHFHASATEDGNTKNSAVEEGK